MSEENNPDNPPNNLGKIKSQIEQMKKRLEEVDKVLHVQHNALESLDENTSNLIKEANTKKKDASVENIMKNVFAKKSIPKILQNQTEKAKEQITQKNK